MTLLNVPQVFEKEAKRQEDQDEDMEEPPARKLSKTEANSSLDSVFDKIEGDRWAVANFLGRQTTLRLSSILHIVSYNLTTPKTKGIPNRFRLQVMFLLKATISNTVTSVYFFKHKISVLSL